MKIEVEELSGVRQLASTLLVDVKRAFEAPDGEDQFPRVYFSGKGTKWDRNLPAVPEQYPWMDWNDPLTRELVVRGVRGFSIMFQARSVAVVSDCMRWEALPDWQGFLEQLGRAPTQGELVANCQMRKTLMVYVSDRVDGDVILWQLYKRPEETGPVEWCEVEFLDADPGHRFFNLVGRAEDPVPRASSDAADFVAAAPGPKV